ncbi:MULTISPECIES: DNA polymerase III subunit delta [Bacillus]|uniref:DNA polymerase III subunit delta n=1 Tax=Bacillus TaxID=1386 RepID=UPI000307F191|nr:MULTISPECIES: DNA polymerase III subunit delta [Bacillus]
MAFDVWKQIKNKQFAPIYLVYGTEAFIIKETIRKLADSALSEDETEFNMSTFDLEETPIHLALEEAETFPFMGERKLIILHNPMFLTAEKSKEKVDHNIQQVLEYIDNPSPFSIVVFALQHEKLDERKKITKQLKRQAAVVEANKLKENELISWVSQQATSNGVSIEEEAIIHLIDIAGQNMLFLANEIEKMALYAQEEKVITVGIVNQLASKSLEQNAFALLDFIMNKRTAQAIELLQDLLRQKEPPLKLLATMATQVRIMYVSKELARNGYGQQKIASHLKIHPYRVKLALEKARHFHEKELLIFLNRIADADYKMKTGQMDPTLLLELVILQSGSNRK